MGLPLKPEMTLFILFAHLFMLCCVYPFPQFSGSFFVVFVIQPLLQNESPPRLWTMLKVEISKRWHSATQVILVITSYLS